MPAEKAPRTSLDAVALLERDHDQLKLLFKEFEKAKQPQFKLELARHICEKLGLHAEVEEQTFYPAIKAIPKMRDIVLESLEEHRQIKALIAEVAGMEPSDLTFAPKMKVLGEDFGRHVQDEESEMLPRVRNGLGKKKLLELAHEMKLLTHTLKGGAATGPERITEPVRESRTTGKQKA